MAASRNSAIAATDRGTGIPDRPTDTIVPKSSAAPQRCEIDASTTNGSVRLTDISGTVVAHSLNGSIRATVNRIDQTKPLSFSTLNGTIDVTLPSDSRANVKFKSDHGDIYSDFDIALTGTGATSEESGGSYRVRVDKIIQGAINGGGVEASFYTLNGKIYLRKR